MKICSNCGATASSNDIYCGMCGQPLKETHYMTADSPKPSSIRGKIYTDTAALAAKLKVSQDSIIDIINNYIQRVAHKTKYELFDFSEQANAYSPSLHSFRTYQEKDWVEYHRYLYQKHHTIFQNQTEYLFIIGGDDIIPVPIFPNFTLPHTKDIPADILYGYRGCVTNGIRLESILDSLPNFHVGRLPLGTDATLHHLANYLERSAEVMEKGIPVQMAYAQSDPNWKQVSANVIDDLSRNKLIPEIQANPKFIYSNIFISPFVTSQNINEAFNPYANLYYFNLHGSNISDNPNFIGKSDDGTSNTYVAITPRSFEKSECSNIIITEACYGGKHIGLSTGMSMLLTALSNKTLLYIGSSRVAYGAIDKTIQKSSKYGADIIAKEFIINIMQGYTAGESLHLAKKKTIGNPDTNFSLINELTILEFSLYGDPSLTVLFPNSSRPRSIASTPLSDTMATIYSTRTEMLYEDTSSSILSLVRNRINFELQDINNRIQGELAQFGIRPRKLSAVIKVERGNFQQKIFCYETESGEYPIVVVDEKSMKQDIIMPKSNEENFHLSINYRELYREACQRYGLLSFDDSADTALNAFDIQQARIETIIIDNRIEESSKLQIKTFNAVLDTVYRPSMDNENIYALSCKSCGYDFAVLVNPLSILLETELKESIARYFEKHDIFPIINGVKQRNWTLGSICWCMQDNMPLMIKCGISVNFVKRLDKTLRSIRNDAAHTGNIIEKEFIEFYDNFKDIVKSSSFKKLMELKMQLRKQKQHL